MKKTAKMIKLLVKEAADRIRPQKVILFGSHAYGQPTKDSDVDLLFIKETDLSGLKRYCWASDQINHLLPMDIIIKTPTELKRRLAMGDPFYKEIMKRGKVLYESSR